MNELEITISDLQDIAEILINNGHGGWAVSIGKAIALLKEQEAAYQGAEELLRQKTILFDDAIKRLKEQEAKETLSDAIHDTAKQFRQTIVRCKDCKHWYFADNRIPCEQENVCGRNGIVVTPDWFCADGERRTDDA